MKTINDYIIEKFRISKDINVDDKIDIDKIAHIIHNTLKDNFNQYKQYDIEIVDKKHIKLFLKTSTKLGFETYSNIRKKIMVDINSFIEDENFININNTFISSGDKCIYFRFDKLN